MQRFFALLTLMALAVVALLRQIGVLHARLAPMGTHFGGEGLDIGAVAPGVGLEYARTTLTLLAFTSPTCTICAALKPSLLTLRRQYPEIVVELVDANDSPAVFDAFKVRSTPYVVAVDRDGLVVGRGVANTLEQIEELLRESRLGFSTSVAAASGGSTIVDQVNPEDIRTDDMCTDDMVSKSRAAVEISEHAALSARP